MKNKDNSFQEISDVLNYHQKEIDDLLKYTDSDEYEYIESSDTIKALSFSDILKSAREEGFANTSIDNLLSEEDKKNVDLSLKQLSKEFDNIHKLDPIDFSICLLSSLLSSAVDILFIGIPHSTTEGLKSGKLVDYIREQFSKKFPPKDMEELANKSISKVPYDVQYNNEYIIKEHIEGLSTYYHRLMSIGHDPLLGLFVGTEDICNGTISTIDRNGKIFVQIANYSDITERKAQDIFAALSKQIIHLKTDVNTSMGLPAPLMGVFNLFQFGSIGEENETIAQIVQSMYYEGYDFIHFCSQTIPVMIGEVVTRLCYYLKRKKEGHSVKECIPFSLNRELHPKLESMLFITHLLNVGINTGKVAFTKNPLSINYPEWLFFIKYSYKQLIWAIYKKPSLRFDYIDNKILDELDSLLEDKSEYIF